MSFIYQNQIKMINRFLLIFGLAILSTFAYSQQDQTLISKLNPDFSGAWGGPTYMWAQFGDNSSLVAGGYGGLEFNKCVFIGWGGHKLIDEIKVGDKKLNFRYNGPIVEYMPIAEYVVHPKIGLTTGFGKYEIEGASSDRVVLLQPTLGGEVNITSWFRLNADIGYRATLNADLPEVKDNLGNGLFGTLTLKFGYSWGRSNNRSININSSDWD